MTTLASATSLCGSATVFVVQDVLRSVEHYRDVFGFQTVFTYGEPTFYAGVARDGITIHLQAASATKRQVGQGSVNVFACALAWSRAQRPPPEPTARRRAVTPPGCPFARRSSSPSRRWPGPASSWPRRPA